MGGCVAWRMGHDHVSPPPSPSTIEGEGKKTSVQVLRALHVVSMHAGMARMEGLVGIALLKVRDGDTPVREMGRDFQSAP